MSKDYRGQTIAQLLNTASNITLCPISQNAEKESRINFNTEINRSFDSGSNYFVWYGDRKSEAHIGELFGFVQGYNVNADATGENGRVGFARVVAVLDGAYAPSDWINPKSDRKVYVLEHVRFACSWCDLNETLGHARFHNKAGVNYTPFLAGMSRRKIK